MNDQPKPVITDSPNALTQVVRTLRLVWRLLRDARVIALPKLIIPAALIYVVSPLDFLPDFILGLGQLDDLGVILLSITFFIEFCPRGIVDEHRRAIERGEAASESNDAIEGTYRVVDDDDAKS